MRNSKRKSIHIPLLAAVYIFLPFLLYFMFKLITIGELFILFLLNSLAGLLAYFNYTRIKYGINYRDLQIQEKINVISNENRRESEVSVALDMKIQRYESLQSIVEDINRSLDLDSICTQLSKIAFRLVANEKGVCILYLVDKSKQKLCVYKSVKKDNSVVVKAKEGDIFDLWVLRHTSPLLITDIRSDFRFDQEKVRAESSRDIASVVSSPFISDNSLMGILRVDNPAAGFYSQDDLRLLVVLSEIGAVAIRNAELFQSTQELAIRDGLTGLYTKGFFLERLREECAKCASSGRSLSLLMLDIDHFKKYNDKFGHTAGDMVLKELSRCVQDSVKGQAALTARFGGEEFCIVLIGRERNEALSFAQQLRLNIEAKEITLRRQVSSITASIGVASCPQDTRDEFELIIKADRAMYEAKQKGRNRVVCSGT